MPSDSLETIGEDDGRELEDCFLLRRGEGEGGREGWCECRLFLSRLVYPTFPTCPPSLLLSLPLSLSPSIPHLVPPQVDLPPLGADLSDASYYQVPNRTLEGGRKEGWMKKK